MALHGKLVSRGSAVFIAGVLVAAAAVGTTPYRARAAASPTVAAVAATTVPDAAGSTTALTGFALQSSAKVTDTPETISSPGYQPTGWHPAGARSTVYAALVADRTYPDPFYSENMKKPDPKDFQVPWWYRSDFTVNDTTAHSSLNVTGILSAADVYVNGTRVATADRIGGMYPVYELDVTPYVRAGLNSVAFRVQPNDPGRDLTTGWIDWAPGAADNNMGLSQDITVRRTGAVALDDAHVSTTVAPSLSSAELTVRAKVRNDSTRAVTTTVSGTIGDIGFGRDVTLAPGETQQVTFAPADTPQLALTDPKIWWPAGMGDQPMYDLRLTSTAGGAVSTCV
ncbi:glycosyl hydrolase 2 galactose-binding domain-containing protein [Streptomyces sp. NRRL WC-3742]|uniref:glycosyl hydrolase 2 galactose-binding domain-containing protein n=1 Tax=Streptomyces sp. NRRL WC-3742 TaxID=1463934 RepID=UPI0004CB170A|nr:sugar-binding domain-containing protein [Streptomyces sp. NRRL WC-3742]